VVVKRAQPERGRPRYEQRSETHWWACLPEGRRAYLGRTTARLAAGGEQGETYNGFRFAGGFLAFHQRLLSNYGNGTDILASYPRADAEPTITDLLISNGQVSWIYNGTTVTAGG
jgi:hypothetical protein